MTLAACALLGLEVAPSAWLAAVVFSGVGEPYPLLSSGLGLVCGIALGLVLLRQGGISVPSPWERGATRGALLGLAAGAVAVFFLGGPLLGLLGTGTLMGLAVRRFFERTSFHRTS